MRAPVRGSVPGDSPCHPQAPSVLADRFRHFARRECAGISPLYEALGLGVAADPALLALAGRARAGQPAPNMLFAAVHFLLLQGRAVHPLSAFYPSLTPEAAPPRDAFPAFRVLCLEEQATIAAILAHRVVSTNEVGRSAALLPAYARAAERAGGGPLHLIEVGASAGLNLLWDRYAYDYGPAGEIAVPGAALTLRCEAQGAPLPLPAALPRVASRVGIDPEPLDPADPDHAAWLRALVWPEQRERARRLEAALALAAAGRPDIVKGSALEHLPALVRALPPSGTPCISHAFTLNQFDPAARDAFEALLGTLGGDRPLIRVALEWGTGPAPELTLSRYDGRSAAVERLAFCDPHGAWIDWRAPP